MTGPRPTPEPPYRFFAVAFAISIAIGAAVIYFGIHGQLGWGIP